MEPDAFGGQLQEANQLQGEGKFSDSVNLCISITQETWKRTQDGFLSPGDAAERYEQIFQVLYQIRDDRFRDTLGQAYWMLGRCSSFLEFFGEDLSPKYTEYAELSGWDDSRIQTFSLYLKADMEDYEEAVALLEKRAQEDPGAWYYLGDLAMLKEKYEDAEAAYEKVPEDNPNYTSAQLSIAEIREMEFDLYGVACCYDRAIDVEPWNQWLILSRLKNQFLMMIQEAFDWDICYPGSTKVESLLDKVFDILNSEKE